MAEVVKKTVLITGGLGFLGGGLAKYLKSNGYKVIIGSSRPKAYLPLELKNCELVYTNYKNTDTLINACSNIESIVHLAALNADKSNNNPKLAKKINTIGTYNLIQASITKDVKYFLYFSTAHVYGTYLTGQIEENTTLKQSYPYGETHKLAEDFLIKSINNKMINGSIFRLSNAFGVPTNIEADCWMLFINDACRQAVLKKSIVIHSKPETKRDFISLSNVYEITEYFLSNQTIDKSPIFNVGSGVTLTLFQVAKIIANRCKIVFGFKPKIVFSENIIKSDLIFKYKVDKLNKKMGYRTNNNFNATIDDLLKFCKKQFH